MFSFLRLEVYSYSETNQNDSGNDEENEGKRTFIIELFSK